MHIDFNSSLKMYISNRFAQVFKENRMGEKANGRTNGIKFAKLFELKVQLNPKFSILCFVVYMGKYVASYVTEDSI